MAIIKIKPSYPKKIFRHPYLRGVLTGFIIGSGIYSILLINDVWGMFLFGWGIVMFMVMFTEGDGEYGKEN